MRCEEAEIRLMELIEEELPPAQRLDILSHLQGCATCAAEFSAYRDLLTQVRAEPVPEPPPRFWDEFLPALKRRIATEAFRESGSSVFRLTPWVAGVRAWCTLRRSFIAGLAVAAASVLILIRLPGFLPVGADRSGTPPSVGQPVGPIGEREPARVALTDDGRRHPGEPMVVAGELVEDPSVLAAAIRRLPWVDEMADRFETAWASRPESDTREWLTLLSEEERQIVVDQMRNFRWSPS